jgi:hypothetical protein
VEIVVVLLLECWQSDDREMAERWIEEAIKQQQREMRYVVELINAAVEELKDTSFSEKSNKINAHEYITSEKIRI